jgi:hypothetical protein
MGETLHLGNPTVVEAFADRTPFGAVFEDDGKVAYFYGLDTRLGDNPIVDSVCVYNVSELFTRPAGVLDVHEPYDVELVWSADQQRVALLLNRYPHAAFDFATKRGYCRSNFPPGSRWSATHAWDDRAIDFLIER